MKKAILIVSLFAVAACSGGGGGGSAIDNNAGPTATQNASPGGLWAGIDSSDKESMIVVNENGRYFFVAGPYSGGSGLLTVVNDDFVQGSLSLPDERGLAAPDGGSNDDCNLKGSLAERESMTLDVRCRMEENQQVLTTISFTYDQVYERDSSLSTLAGIFDFSAGLVLDINANGTIFGQDSVSGCVIDGEAKIDDADFNIYGLTWGLIDCVGPDASLNGQRFSGLALLDNTVSPEQLIVAMSRNSNSEATTSNSGSSSTLADGEQSTIIVFADRL